jgi:hypothetical protein
MKQNIYQKLHKAACEASGVVKGKKVPGMHFNPLQHDEVQKVAMEALLSNGLYPVCTYSNELTDSYIMVTCFMKIHDIDNPTDYVEINGCSAMGNLDKFGSINQTQQLAGEVNINIEDMKKSFASAIHLPRLKHLKDTVYADQIKYLQTKNPNEFSELKRVYETSYGTTKQP